MQNWVQNLLWEPHCLLVQSFRSVCGNKRFDLEWDPWDPRALLCLHRPVKSRAIADNCSSDDPNEPKRTLAHCNPMISSHSPNFTVDAWKDASKAWTAAGRALPRRPYLDFPKVTLQAAWALLRFLKAYLPFWTRIKTDEEGPNKFDFRSLHGSGELPSLLRLLSNLWRSWFCLGLNPPRLSACSTMLHLTWLSKAPDTRETWCETTSLPGVGCCATRTGPIFWTTLPCWATHAQVRHVLLPVYSEKPDCLQLWRGFGSINLLEEVQFYPSTRHRRWLVTHCPKSVSASAGNVLTTSADTSITQAHGPYGSKILCFHSARTNMMSSLSCLSSVSLEGLMIGWSGPVRFRLASPQRPKKTWNEATCQRTSQLPERQTLEPKITNDETFEMDKLHWPQNAGIRFELLERAAMLLCQRSSRPLL